MTAVTRKLLTAAIALLLPLGTVACAPSATRAGKAGPTDLLVDVATADALRHRIQWQTDLGLTGGRVIESISILDGQHIAVVESGNFMSLIDANSGGVLWRKSVAASTDRLTRPQLLGDKVVICSQSRIYVLRLDNGDLARANSMAYLTNETPVIRDGVLVAGTPGGLVFAQSVMTGFVKWRYQLTGAIEAPVVWAKGLILATDAQGTVAALTPVEGRIVWRRFKPPWGRVTALPAATDDTVYIACEDQKLYAFERAGGELYWAYLTEDPLTTSPVALGPAVYQHVPQRGLVALDAFDGTELWRSAASGTPVQLTGNRLMLLDGTTVRVLDARDGAVTGEASFDRADWVVCDAESGADVYLARRDGRVMKLSPR